MADHRWGGGDWTPDPNDPLDKLVIAVDDSGQYGVASWRAGRLSEAVSLALVSESPTVRQRAVDVVEAARFLIQTRARFVDEHLAEIEALYEKTRKSADSPEDATAADISEAVSDAFHGILIDVASENIRAQELEAHIGRLYDAVWEHKHLSMALSEKGMTFEGFRELAERATAAADSALTMAQVEAAIARLEEVVDANPAYAPAWKNLGRMEEVRRAMDRATA